MARGILEDFLQDASFWLMDIAVLEPLAIPIFAPTFGFHTISSPEITLEAVDVNEGNNLFGRKVIKRGEVGTISMTRGVRFMDSDFYRWTHAALRGNTSLTPFGGGALGAGTLGGASPRRNLLLMQCFRANPLGVPNTDGSRNNAGGIWSLLSAQLPARAWLLEGCLPVRYKPGSDFDASSGQISMMELDVAVERLEEISLAV